MRMRSPQLPWVIVAQFALMVSGLAFYMPVALQSRSDPAMWPRCEISNRLASRLNCKGLALTLQIEAVATEPIATIESSATGGGTVCNVGAEGLVLALDTLVSLVTRDLVFPAVMREAVRYSIGRISGEPHSSYKGKLGILPARKCSTTLYPTPE